MLADNAAHPIKASGPGSPGHGPLFPRKSLERRTSQFLPILAWLPHYRLGGLRGDVTGAATAWAIVVPESVAYAQIAGVPPQNAFYAAPVALIVYAIFGPSRNTASVREHVPQAGEEVAIACGDADDFAKPPDDDHH